MSKHDDESGAHPRFIVERIAGNVQLSPRLPPVHNLAASAVGALIGSAFQLSAPGGWIVLYTPEIHLGDDIVVPDVAAWKQSRLQLGFDADYFTLPPDWVVEVLAPKTADMDRAKLPVYAAAGVGHAWLVDPRSQSLEVLRREGMGWQTLATHRGTAQVRAEPFEALTFDLDVLWC